MAEVSDITIKRTQDSLGKLIKKPVLTDKLLRKPPFKFLHDIIHAVIDTTGFLDGLYSAEELQVDNIKDRDGKIAFLQKTIDALKLATKQDVKARPSKIVAGLEADKTNELLIAIAKAIDRKIDTTEAVALVKTGKHNETQKKESKTTKAADGGSRKATKESKESTASKKVKSSDTKTFKKTSTSTKVAKQSSKDSTDSKKVKAKTNSQNKEKDKDKDKNREREKKSAKAESIEKTVEDVAHVNGNANNIIENPEPMPNVAKAAPIEPIQVQDDLPKDKPVKQDGQELRREDKSAKLTRSADKEERKSDERNHNKQDEIELPKSGASIENKTKSQENIINDAPSAVISNNIQEKTSGEKPRSSKSRKSHSKNDTEKVSTNFSTKSELMSSKSVDQPLMESSKTNETSKPPKTRTALRSGAVRPISARPSAPRRRDRNVRQILHTESFVQDPNPQNQPNKKNNMPEFDDADNIVITETIPDNITALDETTANKDDGEIDGKMHGHLVQQILDTQTSILKDVKNESSAVTDENILNDRKSITRNMTELRKMIQSLSLYITPLGKMMEYFQEDVDAMQIELLMWKKAGETAQTDIKEEQRSTDKLLENFKYQLAEINNSIKDHIEQINNTTTNIIQNEEKISKIFATL